MTIDVRRFIVCDERCVSAAALNHITSMEKPSTRPLTFKLYIYSFKKIFKVLQIIFKTNYLKVQTIFVFNLDNNKDYKKVSTYFDGENIF